MAGIATSLDLFFLNLVLLSLLATGRILVILARARGGEAAHGAGRGSHLQDAVVEETLANPR